MEHLIYGMVIVLLGVVLAYSCGRLGLANKKNRYYRKRIKMWEEYYSKPRPHLPPIHPNCNSTVKYGSVCDIYEVEAERIPSPREKMSYQEIYDRISNGTLVVTEDRLARSEDMDYGK